MKILYLHSEPLNSEMANLIQVRSMCSAMSELGHQVILSIPKSKNINIRTHVNKDEYIIHYRNNYFNNSKFNKYINFYSVKQAVIKHSPDIIYVRTPYLLFQTRTFRIPTIYELHHNKLHQGSIIVNYFWKRFLKRTSSKSYVKKIVCISQALTNYWTNQGLQADKIITAHDAIDYNLFINHVSKTWSRKVLNIDLEIKVVSYIGRLYKNRKIDNILILAKQYPKVYFMIIGGPDDEAKNLKRLVKEEKLNNVLIKGQIPHNNIINYLYASDVLLALWSKEVKTINYCSPLKLFEYMGAGRIIVAHGYPTILEILKNEYNALICKPESISDLIEKVGIAINTESPNQMEINSRSDALIKHTWQVRAKNILNNIS